MLNRCIPGVDVQTYPGTIEHVITSDGPDPELAAKLFPPLVTKRLKRWYTSLPVHEEGLHWGHLARLHAIEHSTGELIGYVDDDDQLRPKHVELLAAALAANPGAGWAYSRMASHRPDETVEVGHGPPSCGNIGTPMIMHRRGILEHGSWGPPSALEDWEMINRWLHAGITYAQVEEVTIDVWPSIFWRG